MCVICGMETPEDVWHVVLECSDRRYRVARQEMLDSVKVLLKTIGSALFEALEAYIEGYGSESYGGMLEAVKLSEALQDSAHDSYDWTSETGQFLLYRLLTVMPFGPTTIRYGRQSRLTPVDKLARDLGQLFEYIDLPRRFLRRLSNEWIRWSYKWLKRFGDIRCKNAGAIVATASRG
jgi:hypothetical protein